MYISTTQKLIFSISIAFCWFTISLMIALPWIDRLSYVFNRVWAWSLVLGIALIPGFFNAFLTAALLFDNRPKYKCSILSLPSVSIIVAAYNEESCIEQTLESITRQIYYGELEIIITDDGSKDATAKIVTDFIQEHYEQKTFLLLTGYENCGKSEALNRALNIVTHELVITLDADSYLFKDAILNIVCNYLLGPKNTAAVAGTVLVRNSRKNWLTKLQEWEYFLALSAVKRCQSLFQGTLVAQGAFSLYTKEALLKIGGWKKLVGEDIVLTWAFRKEGYRVGHAENAVVFTNVPETYHVFFNQRRRWSRGLIEAFRQYPEVVWQVRQNSIFIWLNLLFPFLDFMFLFGFVPGLIMAVFFHWYEIVSMMTLVLIPMAMLLNYLTYRTHSKTFEELGLKIRKNIFGFITFMLLGQLVLAPSCVRGYFDEFFGQKKSWVTKDTVMRKNRYASIILAVILTLMPTVSLSDNVSVSYDHIFDNSGFMANQESTSLKLNDWSLKQIEYFAKDHSTSFNYSQGFLTKSYRHDNFSVVAGPGIILSSTTTSPGYAFTSDYKFKDINLEFSAERSPLMTANRSDVAFITVTDYVSDNLTLTLDGQFKNFSVVGGLVTQQISDGNAKNGFITKFVYDYNNFIVTLKDKFSWTDYDTKKYFSPNQYQQHWLMLTYAQPFFEDNFMLKLTGGPGMTQVNNLTDMTHMYEAKISSGLGGVKSESHFSCLSSTYSYEYCTVGASMLVNF